MYRRSRHLVIFLALVLASLIAPPLVAQIPIPLQEQIATFSSLPAAQQQALIRELQQVLPPAQRDAVIDMLLQQQGRRTRPIDEQSSEFEAADLAADIAASIEPTGPDRALGPGDTLIIEVERRQALDATEPGILDPEMESFLERLTDGNPYELDDAGRLYLPGVPAVALAGLDVEQAQIRLRAERRLRPYDLKVTMLPLDPVGTAALTPFGYDLFRGTASTFAPAINVPVPVDYVIGPGDTLNVQLFGAQNSEYFLEVSRDGNISLPQIGPLNVSGQSFADVRNLIGDRVMQQLGAAVRASTTLGDLRSIQVYVTGDVNRPGSYTVSSLATMINALFVSGGVSRIGSLRSVALRRGDSTVATLDLYDLLLHGDTSDDVRLQPGDVVFVPPLGATVAIEGEVRRPAIYELNGEQTVAEIVELAGGFSADANRAAIKLERIVPGRGIAVTDLDLGSTSGPEGPVQNGDVLRVEARLEQLEDTVRLVGNVQRPGLYQWRPGMTVSELLPSADFIKPMSDIRYVLIRREAVANLKIDVLSVDLEAVWAQRIGSTDIALDPRDTIYVFHLETGRQQYIEPILEELSAQVGPNDPLPVVRVGGQVRAFGDYPLEPGMRVSDLLRAGGGLTDSSYSVEAELTRYKIVEGEYRETSLLDLDLAAILSGNRDADVALAPYDYLSIKEVSGWREQEAVTLRGEFVFPGTYPIRQGERLSSVIARAGGLTRFAHAEASVFTRTELREREIEQLETLARRIESDLASLALSDQGSSDAVETGQTLLSQLRNSEATGRLVIRLDEIVDGILENDIVLQGGDELFVPELRQEVTVIGEVQYPTSHTFQQELSRDDYIDRSGGLTRRADKKRIYVVRANGEVVVDRGARWFRRDPGVEVQPGDTVVAPLDVERIRPLTLWSSITQIVYNLAIAAAAVNSF